METTKHLQWKKKPIGGHIRPYGHNATEGQRFYLSSAIKATNVEQLMAAALEQEGGEEGKRSLSQNTTEVSILPCKFFGKQISCEFKLED